MSGPVPLFLVLLGLLQAVLPAPRPRRSRGLFNVLMGGLVLAWVAWLHTTGTHVLEARLWGYTLVLIEVTPLKMVFAWAFGLAYLLWSLYAWTLEDDVERGAGLVYVGCSFGVLFAGDLLTIFLFWEGMALASTLVVLRGKTEEAKRAAYRYLMVHVFGGVLLLTGIGLYAKGDGALLRQVSDIGLDSAGGWLIFVGCLVNAAAWPLAAWVPDAYPAASPTGNVLLGTFTTKTAVYVLVVGFSGEAWLCLFGALMALYGFLYAFATWNFRRLLAYSLVGQVGFMLCAAGAGGDLGASAAAAHAFTHVLYKSLLFMSAGAVFLATGSAMGGQNGKLWKALPWTALFGFVGALAISAVPFTSGYVSKTLIFDAVHRGLNPLLPIVEWILLVVSTAAPLYVGLRFPVLAFSGTATGEAEKRGVPVSMRIAMGLSALLCVAIGVYPPLLLDLLPLDVEAYGVHVYTLPHVLKQLGLLFIGTVLFLAWWRVIRRYPLRRVDRLADTDTLYLGLAAAVGAFARGPMIRVFARMSDLAHETIPRALGRFGRNPAGAGRVVFERARLALAGLAGSEDAIDRAQARYRTQRARYRRAPGGPWPIGLTVLYGVLLLGVYVLLLLFA